MVFENKINKKKIYVLKKLFRAFKRNKRDAGQRDNIKLRFLKKNFADEIFVKCSNISEMKI